MTVSSSNSATVKMGRQASQPLVRGMKYMPDSRQNCLAQRARLSSNHAITTKPMTTKTKTFAIHNRLVSHSVDQLISIHPPRSFVTLPKWRLPYALGACERYSVTLQQTAEQWRPRAPSRTRSVPHRLRSERHMHVRSQLEPARRGLR